MAEDIQEITGSPARVAARLYNFITGSAVLLPTHINWLDRNVAPIIRTQKKFMGWLLSREELQKAQDVIKTTLGTNAAISEFALNNDSLFLRTPNPENPSILDKCIYDINGLTKKNEIMKMPNFNTLKKDFSLSDINLTDAVNFIEKAKKRVNMQDAAVSYVSIERDWEYNNRTYASVKNQLIFDNVHCQ